jgi:hypothetical protein
MKEGGGGGEDILWTHCARDGRGGQVTRLLWRTIWCNCCHGCDPVTEVDEDVVDCLSNFPLDRARMPASAA